MIHSTGPHVANVFLMELKEKTPEFGLSEGVWVILTKL